MNAALSLMLTRASPSSSAQPKFKTIFPDYAGPQMTDLPVMGDSASSAANVPPSCAQPASSPDSPAGPTEGVNGRPAPAPRIADERAGVLSRWRTQIKWALLVMLLSWVSARFLGDV